MKQKNADKLLAFVIAIGVMFWMAAFVSLVVLKPTPPKPDATETVKKSTVHVYTDEGRGFCTGFIISDKLAVTAAHCIENLMPFAPVIITDFNKISHFVEVKNIKDETDYALLTGDFKTIPPVKIIQNATEIDAVVHQQNLVLCGYPYTSQTLSCPAYLSSVRFEFRYAGKSFVYPGMSGGPVFDSITGDVIGVITGVTAHGDQDKVIISPLTELCSSLNCN